MSMRDRDDRSRATRHDERALRERATQLREDERKFGGHVFSRHVDVGPGATHSRAQQMLNQRDSRVSHRVADATRWTSERSLVRAVDGVERTQAFKSRMSAAEDALRRGVPPETVRPVVRVPLHDALGPDWRSAVAGHRADATGVRQTTFTRTAEVVAGYRARPGGGWRLHTCYPVPQRPAP